MPGASHPPTSMGWPYPMGPQHQPYMMAPGADWRHGWQMGLGMAAPRAMPPHFGRGLPFHALAKDLSAEEARHMLGHWLDWIGNKRLKVGEVTVQDDDTIVAEIVTLDDSLVQRLEIDRHSGWAAPTD